MTKSIPLSNAIWFGKEQEPPYQGTPTFFVKGKIAKHDLVRQVLNFLSAQINTQIVLHDCNCYFGAGMDNSYDLESLTYACCNMSFKHVILEQFTDQIMVPIPAYLRSRIDLVISQRDNDLLFAGYRNFRYKQYTPTNKTSDGKTLGIVRVFTCYGAERINVDENLNNVLDGDIIFYREEEK